MSADTLRRAAALMRERAEAATASPWVPAVDDHGRKGVDVGIWSDGATRYPVESLVVGNPNHMADAEHIASWHPTVALAVADWLDGVASTWWAGHDFEEISALAVARAYLGEAA